MILTPNSKNILFITTLVFFYGVHCTQVKFVYLVIEAKIDNFIKMKHDAIGCQCFQYQSECQNAQIPCLPCYL